MSINKKIMLEVEIDDDFTPSNKFNNKNCKECPFYFCDKEEYNGKCVIDIDGWGKCPIKKYFKES